MLVTTSESIAGTVVQSTLGVVEGSVVVTKHIGRDFAAVLKSVFGGELRGYSEMLEDARSTAKSRMMKAASSIQADAVISVRYTTSAITPGASEVLCYGTAVTYSA